jgi:acyl-CoA thioesterase I
MTRFSVALLLFLLNVVSARAESFTILALGDSLTAGLGLDQSQAFPAKLQAALKVKGHDVVVINAGVSGDTVAQGEARLDWAMTEEIDAVIVELGANDALRGLPVPQAEAALGKIIDNITSRNLPLLLAGMKAPPNLGPDYGTAFDQMFAKQAARVGVVSYPFFLEGVAADPKLNQSDGIHPNAIGVDVIVLRMLPFVEKLLPH